MKLFVDCDGVCADFDRGYVELVGPKGTEDVDWGKVAKVSHFYARLPPMPDLYRLWDYIAGYHPTILTGVPDVKGAEQDKRDWAAEFLGSSVEVICCKSKDKSDYCNPGDVLIDDWEKYRYLWENKGGVWITHTNAYNTIYQLQRIGL